MGTVSRSSLLAVAAVVALAACATGRGGGDDPFGEGASSFVIEVRNDRGPSGSLRVFIVPSGGSAKLLGTMIGEGPKRFSFAADRPRAEHRLAARTPEGERFVSRPFVLQGSRGITWEVESNHLIRR